MISIQQLNFGYASTDVFRNLSLQFEPGKIYGLLGQNGVGKTTLLKLLAGLLKPYGRQDAITVDGQIPWKRQASFYQRIAFLPENPLIPDMRITEYLRYNAPFYPNFSQNLFEEATRALELDPKAKFKHLSQGQRKKALIACVLAYKTPILLLDEPTNGLDIPSKAQFRKLISGLCQEDSTFIISTHQVRDLENIIDPVVILDGETLLLQASIEEIGRKLFFHQDSRVHEGCLYSEPYIGGYTLVDPNTSGEESPVNIEAFFNACLAHKSEIQNLFKA